MKNSSRFTCPPRSCWKATLLCALSTVSFAWGQVNITLGSTSGSGSQALTSSVANGGFIYNFGVTASAGTLTMTNLRISLSRDNQTTAPVTVEVFSGLGATGTSLGTVTISRDLVNVGSYSVIPVNFAQPLALTQGAYSVKISTTAAAGNASYNFRPGPLVLAGTDANNLTLDTSKWIQDSNTTGSAGNTLTPSQGYVLADHGVSTQSVNLGRFHTGGTGSTTSFNYSNVAPASSNNTTESLTVASTSTTGAASVSNVPTSFTVRGNSSNVTLGVANQAGLQTGTVQLNFNSVTDGSSSTRTGGPQSVGSRTITVTGTGYTGRSEWNTDANGSWNKNDFTRWDTTGGTPGLDGAASVGDTALFGTVATADRTIGLDGNAPQLRQIEFNNATSSYTIARGSGNTSIGLGNATNAGVMNNAAGRHTISADIVLGNRLTYTGAAGTTTDISGAVSGNAQGLTKQGLGTLRMSGNNSFNGTTIVAAGTLIVNGTNASATTVNSGATLGGSGTISGATTISGIHSPGNSPGVQSFGSGLTYNGGASVLWELIANSTSGRGSNYDAINVTGNLNFAGSTTLTLDFDFFQAEGSGLNSVVDWGNSFWDTSKLGPDGWEVFRVTDGTISGFENLTLGGSLADAQTDLLLSNRGSFSLTQSGNSIYLNYTAYDPNANVIPESTSTLLGVMGASLLVRRRRTK